MIWFRKLAAVFLLCFGAAFVSLPFPPEIAGERTTEVVSLSVQPPPFTEESARARFGDAFHVLDYEGMEAFPGVREAVLGLTGQSTSRCVPSTEWHGLLTELSVGDPGALVWAFRNEIHRIVNAKAEDYGPEGALVCFDGELLGAFDNIDWYPMHRPDDADLDGYPELKAELERLAVGPTPAEGGRDVPPRQWRRFNHRTLEGRDFRPQFVVLGKLFSGAIEEQLVPWSLTIPWLRNSARAGGAVAFVLGALLLISAYRATAARPGIPVASTSLAVFCDSISLIAGSIFAVLAIDTLWIGPIKQASLIGLEPEWPWTTPITGLHFISLPVIFVVLPLLMLWFTSLSAQRIEVDNERVISRGALGSVAIPWRDLENVCLRDQQNPFAFSVIDFRKLQRVVDFDSAEVSLTINEPGSRDRKKKIVGALMLHAPTDKIDLVRVLEEW